MTVTFWRKFYRSIRCFTVFITTCCDCLKYFSNYHLDCQMYTYFPRNCTNIAVPWPDICSPKLGFLVSEFGLICTFIRSPIISFIIKDYSWSCPARKGLCHVPTWALPFPPAHSIATYPSLLQLSGMCNVPGKLLGHSPVWAAPKTSIIVALTSTFVDYSIFYVFPVC